MDRRYTRAHKARRGTRKQVELLGADQELADRYGVSLAELEQELKRRGVAYHKDATGRIYA